MLRLRSRNQHGGANGKFAPIELLLSGDVLRRLAFQPLVQIAAVVNPPEFAQCFVGVSVQPRSFASNGVCEKYLSCEARSENPALLEKRRALMYGLPDAEELALHRATYAKTRADPAPDFGAAT